MSFRSSTGGAHQPWKHAVVPQPDGMQDANHGAVPSHSVGQPCSFQMQNPKVNYYSSKFSSSVQGFACETLGLGHSHSAPDPCKTCSYFSLLPTFAPVLEFPVVSPLAPRQGKLSAVENNG